MHRVKVRVVEDALDANNTIARANRDDFDRHGVTVVNLMSAPGAGKTTLLERTLGGLRGVRAAARRAAEHRQLDLPLARARRALQPRHDHVLLEHRPLAHRIARDDAPVEVQRVRHDLAQVPDAQLHAGHAPAGRVAEHRPEHRGGDRHLVH